MGILYPIGILLVIVIAALVAFSTGYFVGPTATVVIAAVIDVFTGWGFFTSLPIAFLAAVLLQVFAIYFENVFLS